MAKYTMSYQKVAVIILLAIVISCWLYAMLGFSDIDFGDNVIRIIKESDINEHQNSRWDNSIPIRQTHSRHSFMARVKRGINEEKATIEPAMEMTKSSQQIQFTPELGYFYGTHGSMDPYQLTDPVQYSSFTPTYLPYQPYGQIACFPNPEQGQNPYAPFFCTYIPAKVPPVTYQFPAIAGIPDYNIGRDSSSDQMDFANEKLNPFAHLLQEYVRECPPNYFRCDDNTKCIQKYQWCDNRVDCPDSSDEKKCSCRDRLDVKRFCDNYFDCPNGEDELGCFDCAKDEMSCHEDDVDDNEDDADDKPRKCFKMQNRCDSENECNNGKDEEDCNVLTKTYVASGLGVFPVGFFNGFLQRNYRGKWYHVCGEAPKWAWEACLTKLGHLSKKPTHEMVLSPKHHQLGPFLQQDNSIVNECPEQILFVKCPDPGDARSSRIKTKVNINSQNYFTSVSYTNSSSDPILSIVGGRPSSAGAWPFISAINKDGKFHCGGALVDPYWILSAAHCFFGAQQSYFEIEAGMLRRHSFSPAHQIRRVKGIIIHPKFNPQILSHDIALVRLNEPFYYNEWVGPVTLPKSVSYSGWNMEPSPGASCVALGWGALVEGGPDPDHLQEVAMPIVECRHSRDRNVAEICAGYRQGGRDACQGDSGGPLMCRDSNSEWYIGGVVSHGVGCARVNEPGAYTKVSYFVDWINDITKGQFPLTGMLQPIDKCPGFSCRRPFNRCIPAKKRCNGFVDCLEAEDEGNCPPSSLIHSAADFLKGMLGRKQPQQQHVNKLHQKSD